MGLLTTILVGILVFTALILLMVGLLLFAARKLMPQGAVKININAGTRELDVKPGSTLLNTLSAEQIFLPSACGGTGTCALCKCTVIEGGGEILSTESGQLTKAEIKNGMRLACQMKVKEDLKLEIPPEVFDIRRYECIVRSNHNVATFIKELVLEMPDGETLDFRAGSYIQVDVPAYRELSFLSFNIGEPYREDWNRFDHWSLVSSNEEACFRAYSMANPPQENNIIVLNVRIAAPPPETNCPPGICSSYLFNLHPGDHVVISGPYGEFFAKESPREMCFIGGGAGMAPMRSHIFDQLKRIGTDRRISFWYGGRSLRELFYIDEFRALEQQFPNFSLHIALSDPLPEDEWKGSTGFIHQIVFDEYLASHTDPTEVEYYLCGPPVMLQCAMKMLHDLGVEPDMILADDFGT